MAASTSYSNRPGEVTFMPALWASLEIWTLFSSTFCS